MKEPSNRAALKGISEMGCLGPEDYDDGTLSWEDEDCCDDESSEEEYEVIDPDV